jgi:hypothetical protein
MKIIVLFEWILFGYPWVLLSETINNKVVNKMKLHLLTMIEVHDAFNLFTIKGLIGCFKLKYRLMIKFKAIKNADVGNLICLYFTKSPITCICICTSLKKILIQTLEKGRIMSSVHSLIKEVRSIVIIF